MIGTGKVDGYIGGSLVQIFLAQENCNRGNGFHQKAGKVLPKVK